jgi:hypothetical protein
MFRRKPKSESRPLTEYEERVRAYEEQQRHEFRKVYLGSDYLDRYSGTWREAETNMKKSDHKWWDWFLS